MEKEGHRETFVCAERFHILEKSLDTLFLEKGTFYYLAAIKISTKNIKSFRYFPARVALQLPLLPPLTVPSIALPLTRPVY